MKILKSVMVAAFLALLVLAGIFIHIKWGPGGVPGEEFFDLAAQTMPILLVALAVEAQAREFDVLQTGKSIRLAAVILLVLGETSAIIISANLLDPGYESTTFLVLLVLTSGGLLGGFLGVIAVALFPAPKKTVVGPKTVLQGNSAQEKSAPQRSTNRGARVAFTAAASLLGVLLARALFRLERLRSLRLPSHGASESRYRSWNK